MRPRQYPLTAAGCWPNVVDVVPAFGRCCAIIWRYANQGARTWSCTVCPQPYANRINRRSTEGNGSVGFVGTFMEMALAHCGSARSCPSPYPTLPPWPGSRSRLIDRFNKAVSCASGQNRRGMYSIMILSIAVSLIVRPDQRPRFKPMPPEHAGWSVRSGPYSCKDPV